MPIDIEVRMYELKRKVRLQELNTNVSKLKHRQKFIGITNNGRCVRCICIKLKTGVKISERRGLIRYFEPHIFSLERLEPYEEIWGVK